MTELDIVEGLRGRIAELERELGRHAETERARAMSVSLLQATLEATTDGLLVVDLAGRVTSANGRFVELWRIPQALLATGDDQRVLAHVIEQLADPAAFTAKVAALYGDRLAESFDLLEFKDGRAFERYSRPQLLDGEPVGRVWSFRDVTERRRAEQEAERSKLQDQVIAAQRLVLSQLSTPLIPISAEVLVMPLIGTIDDERARQIVATLLDGIARTRARVVIVDITGVAGVDTQVAGGLLRAAQAVKLLGAQVVLTGIRPEVAQTLVSLGVDLGGLVTRSTVQTGIAYATERRG
ncbi:MAG TPA: STAS domain-containing protein [Nannocystis sp.]